MLNIDPVTFNTQATTFVLILTRILTLLFTDTVFGSKIVTQKYKFMLAILLSVIVFSFVKQPNIIDTGSLTFTTLILQQILIGLIISIIFQFIFHIALYGGQIIAYQSGLSFAKIIDPNTGMDVSMVSQFYYITALLLFLSLNGHLMVIQFLVDSFNAAPLANSNFFSINLTDITNFSAIIFSGGIAIALPCITSLLIVNIAFGILTRSAPQLNILNFGLPITIALTFAMMFISFHGVMNNMEQLFQNGFQFLHQTLGVS